MLQFIKRPRWTLSFNHATSLRTCCILKVRIFVHSVPEYVHSVPEVLSWRRRTPEVSIYVLGGPISYLWPTRTELSRNVSENRKFLGRNISVICPGSCCVTEIQITSCSSKKEFCSSPFCDLYRGCAASRKSFLRLHLLIF